ncbi:cobalamin (vitamin B12) biosynthesis CbiD protein [Methanolacinia petrolearia DSM 11571]|uniref:Cobalt-precorrin-5B C(1)-methyltransferase n=1 Tax=Methanolacinia petrolearia (strain DSM 11571 / OCM 486 / SEBR 4847) TaxID=679926 RepID=E1RHX5_METP4|nr:cobalt-precorrin-5B (C(1))-methyltransferase [Methanolacinia petrolearia]ADN36513.1 cobalamin (vitamin B12) biosynthesis CbiD protein [Methanolacinia petrolearia DSM 11571]
MKVIDPVTGFEYPEDWVRLCKDKETLELVRRGLAILTSTGEILKRGFTTGTTAAAACKAAVLSLGTPVSEVDIMLPCNLRFEVKAEGKDGKGTAHKYSGDYKNDITSGLQFSAKAVETGSGIHFTAGEGVGRFERETPRYKIGDPAISPPAMNMILRSIKEAAEILDLNGVSVELSIPKGREIGEQTLNPKVGVMGGISILGSTGLVEPWDDHLSEDVFERIRNTDTPVLTTGRTGLRYSRMLFPDNEVVLVGKFMGRAIEAANGRAILCGLPALILKFINPAILDGTGYKTVEELTMSDKWESILKENLNDYKKKMPGMRVVIIGRNGEIIGDSG